MAKEIMLIQSVASLGQTIASMISAVRSCKGISKQDAVIFEEQLKFIKARIKAKGIEELCSVTLEQLQKTYNNIVQHKYSGEMLRIATEMLNFQHQALQNIIASYVRS